MTDVEHAKAEIRGSVVVPSPTTELDFADLAIVARRQASVFAGTPDERDSIAQEALTRAWEWRHRFDPSRGLVESWLFGLVRNVAREHYRDRRRWQSLSERLLRVRSAHRPTDRGDVVDAVMHLSPTDQELVYLRYWERRSHREIAGRLGITDAACRQRLRRAVVQIGRQLR